MRQSNRLFHVRNLASLDARGGLHGRNFKLTLNRRGPRSAGNECGAIHSADIRLNEIEKIRRRLQNPDVLFAVDVPAPICRPCVIPNGSKQVAYNCKCARQSAPPPLTRGLPASIEPNVVRPMDLSSKAGDNGSGLVDRRGHVPSVDGIFGDLRHDYLSPDRKCKHP